VQPASRHRGAHPIGAHVERATRGTTRRDPATIEVRATWSWRRPCGDVIVASPDTAADADADVDSVRQPDAPTDVDPRSFPDDPTNQDPASNLNF